MINLKVEPYCHSCNDFEAHVVKIYAGADNLYNCTVYCEHRDKCAMIAKHIQKEMIPFDPLKFR